MSTTKTDNLKSQIKSYNKLFGGKTPPPDYRTLSDKEIKQLTAQGNICTDWTQIFVSQNFDGDNIFRNFFIGTCFLGYFKPKNSFNEGIINSKIIDSVISDNCLIRNVGEMNNYIIAKNSQLTEINSITCSKNADFGVGCEITIGSESGNRKSFISPSLNWQTYKQTDIDTSLKSKYGIVQKSAIIKNCNTIIDLFVDKNCIIDGAECIKNSMLIDNAADPIQILNGSIVINSIIHGAAIIDSQSIVENSVILNNVKISHQAKVYSSIIDEFSEIGKGEVISSIAGPFTGLHHQSLLISAIWPAGRGNISYGANVGSNHTGKAPDQEIICGEGIFFGLGTNVKFPSNFEGAPYSIISTGVTTLPQKVTFPFSLINTPSVRIDDLSPAINEIFPGWVFSDNFYMLVRMMKKFSDKSGKVHNIFTKNILLLADNAVDRLFNVKKTAKYYTEADIAGLGKNFITEESREKALHTYGILLEYCLFKDYFDIIKKFSSQEEIDKYFQNANDTLEDDLFHSYRIVEKEISKNVQRYYDITKTLTRSLQEAKERDDKRGSKIIDDYYDAVTPANEDCILAYFKQLIKEEFDAIDDFTRSLKK